MPDDYVLYIHLADAGTGRDAGTLFWSRSLARWTPRLALAEGYTTSAAAEGQATRRFARRITPPDGLRVRNFGYAARGELQDRTPTVELIGPDTEPTGMEP